MKVQADLTAREMRAGKQPVLCIPALRLWKQMTRQQQKQLAKCWAQLLRRAQLSLEGGEERQDVED